MWVSGSGRADVIVRSAWPVDRLRVEVESPIRTVLTLTAGSEPVTRTLVPRQVQTFDLKTSGVRGFGDYDYLLTVRSTDGFIPHLMEPGNGDYRNLGAQVRFKPVLASAETPSPR
jgi:hypothetical protein